MATNLVAFVLAEGASLDCITGRLTAYNMLETIVTPSFPALLPRLFVVTIYEPEGAAEHFWQRISVSNEPGNALVSLDSAITIEERPHRSISVLRGARFDGPGKYFVKVESSREPSGPWKEISKRTLYLELGDPQTPPDRVFSRVETKSRQPKIPSSVAD